MKAKTIICSIMVLVAIIFCNTGMLDSKGLAAEQIRVLVPLFQINAEKNMNYLQKGVSDILESRLAGIQEVEVVSAGTGTDIHIIEKYGTDPEALRKACQGWKVDYLVYGSLTVIGKYVSLDTKVIEMSGKKGLWSFYRKVDDLDAVIPATEEIAKEIEDTVFKKVVPVQTVTLPPAESDAPGQNEKTDDSRRQHLELPVQIIGLGAGDVDGNGTIEIVAASIHDIHLFQVKGNQLVSYGEIKGEKYHTYLAADVADINKDGKAEIYVSCEHAGSGALTSFVLEWDGERFSTLIRDQNWYFHVNRTEKEEQLLGQRKGISTAYISEIYDITWDGAVLVAGQKGNFPDDTMVFGVSEKVSDTELVFTAVFDANDRLCVIQANGSVSWKSDTSYGGSERFVKAITEHKDTGGERFYLPQRIVTVNLEKQPMLLVPSNDSSSSRFFQNFRNYSTARFLAFTWDGMGFSIRRKSQDLSGYVSDFCVADINNDGRQELIYALVMDRENAFRSGKSYIVSENISDFLSQHP